MIGLDIKSWQILLKKDSNSINENSILSQCEMKATFAKLAPTNQSFPFLQKKFLEEKPKCGFPGNPS
ncbi:hypothetical protein LEP1GSC103_2781 [Leptospira borgpetersenii serovar Javanica str. UI 09931]|uniref:Uncharacterized protein n=2 Tax=Leptospira borgpetersenii TaxID=174 RepID=A0ABN0HV40_LEPBO|nr:hypothetical protein C4Q31_01335 [Leptospira borgpetersenii serovar Ceylonica]EKP12587.1 hypothetical protein LEP1GSC128_3310 [Leptospira borgpetersenii str. 200801926]EKQ91842.1 hypothetical protein LEP1GSC101_3124 [Leptospira borgpetersenii str. UI 09149]EMK13296.1 hypothetical protein LEP1GSC066_3819 [Leptospira sp. serovar Kenya str. Sh9]EMN59382.1 hypothetical protein LEP1GSC090_1475 [Leptospira borgpetersenii serovar Javanica str. MK146]ENO65373.1 hypothetical protein LEP1GSC191_2820 